MTIMELIIIAVLIVCAIAIIKNLFPILLILAVIGGGYYLYKKYIRGTK